MTDAKRTPYGETMRLKSSDVDPKRRSPLLRLAFPPGPMADGNNAR
jgi:hypothetical protein